MKCWRSSIESSSLFLSRWHFDFQQDKRITYPPHQTSVPTSEGLEFVNQHQEVQFHEDKVGLLGVCYLYKRIEVGAEEGESNCGMTDTNKLWGGKIFSWFGKFLPKFHQ